MLIFFSSSDARSKCYCEARQRFVCCFAWGVKEKAETGVDMRSVGLGRDVAQTRWTTGVTGPYSTWRHWRHRKNREHQGSPVSSRMASLLIIYFPYVRHIKQNNMRNSKIYSLYVALCDVEISHLGVAVLIYVLGIQILLFCRLLYYIFMKMNSGEFSVLHDGFHWHEKYKSLSENKDFIRHDTNRTM